jgi:hypothetical protein
MKNQRQINSPMTDQQRKNIVRKCKNQQGWYDGQSGEREVNQDKLIDAECIKRGYTLAEFYHCNGKTLERLLS